MKTKVYWLIGGGMALLLLGWLVPGIVGHAASTDVETETALRQASVELLHPDLVEGAATGEQADLGVAQQLLAQQQAAANQVESRGTWMRFVLIGLGVLCLGSGVSLFYMDQNT